MCAFGVKEIFKSTKPPTGITPSEGVIFIPGSGLESRTFTNKNKKHTEKGVCIPLLFYLYQCIYHKAFIFLQGEPS